MNLQYLGFTQEELAQRVVDKISEEFLTEITTDEDGEPSGTGSSAQKRNLDNLVRLRLEARVRELGEQHLFPKVDALVDGLVLQETNKWGEKIGKSLTFIEYMTLRAEAFIVEEVDYNGKAKRENDNYGWKGTQTRLAFLVHQHLHYQIETAMKNALQIAVGSVAKGIQDTAKLKLEEIAAKLTVNVKTS